MTLDFLPSIPSLSAFSPAVHLTVADIAAETFSQPTSLRVNIKASKTDPFRKGCFIFIGRGRNPICAVDAVLAFLHRRGGGLGPLFIRENGQPLTRELLSTWLKRILGSAGVQGNFSSHSSALKPRQQRQNGGSRSPDSNSRSLVQ